jgi:ATP-binding cassette subfamily B protein
VRQEPDQAALQDDKSRYKDTGNTVTTSLWALIKLMGNMRAEYLSILGLLVAMSAVEGILHPLLVKAIFDQGVIRGKFHAFIYLSCAYLVLGLIVNLISTIIDIWNKSFENRILARLTHQMLVGYYGRDYASILRDGEGYFINRIYGDLREGVLPLLALVQIIASRVVLVISSSLVLIYLSWKAFLIIGALIPISAGVGTLLRRKIEELTTQEREQDGAVLAVLSKALAAFKIVKIFHLEPQTTAALDHRMEEYFATTYRRYKVSRLFQTLNGSMMVLSDFLSMFVGALFVLKGSLSFGAYLAFVNTFWRAVSSLIQTFGHITDFYGLSVIMNRIVSFQSLQASPYYVRGPSLSLNNISFAYNDKPILESVCMRLLQGEKVLIAGPNGSGKTTLANILAGYLAPARGEITLPNRISAMTLPIVFPPLKVGELRIDDSLLKAFDLHALDIHEIFANDLSAGQQQKLAIALALSCDADLYIFDEPLANLDRNSKTIAMDVIMERTRGKMLVLIMHDSLGKYDASFNEIITLDPLVQPVL